MAQSSISSYFNVRKRPAVEECKINRAKKVLLLDSDISGKQHSTIKSIPFALDSKSTTTKTEVFDDTSKMNKINSTLVRRVLTPKLKHSALKIQSEEAKLKSLNKEVALVKAQDSVGNAKQSETETSLNVSKKEFTPEVFKPTLAKTLQPAVKRNLFSKEPTLADMKIKLSRSSRLAELRASILRFKGCEDQLKIAEARTAEVSPVKRNIELEVNISPLKPQSPVKAYLSPKKDNCARKNLFNLLSPTKTTAVHSVPISPLKTTSIKESLTLPYKYRCLAEIFRSIDTVCQILHNRKETIMFRKLKPAVEEMLKRNLTLNHLAQIKFLYPEAFSFKYEKLREFGTGTKRENWELVIQPVISQPAITAELLLQRRRKLFAILIEKLKIYHKEFLTTLDPPMEIPSDKITRWHPQFDIEKVPEIELSQLPECPNQEKFTTGSQVLEKARTFLNCNTRMEQALERLKQSQQTPQPVVEEVKPDSLLKGIPKALLEKVRQKQAAKALQSMTRSGEQDKEAQLYSHLPEVARLARNLFVSERKSVLPIETVLDKLCNSYRVFSNKADMEIFLKTIAKVVNGWLVFHEIRGSVFIKLAKNADLNLVMNKLKSLAEQKLTH